jgi:membrane-bound lytic murein transglycosylase C
MELSMKISKTRAIVLSVIFSAVMAIGVAVLAYNPTDWLSFDNKPIADALPEPVAEVIQSVESLPVFEPEIDDSKPKVTPSSSEEVAEQLKALDEQVTAVWGEEEKKLPSQTEVVKYSEDLQSRSIIDLKDGKLVIQTLVGEDDLADKSLQDALVAALLTSEDPRKVDLLSFKPNPLSTTHPFLFGQIEDNRGRPIESVERAEAFAQWALKRKVKLVASAKGQMKQISLPLNANHRRIRADRFAKYIEEAAKKYQQDPALLYAIAETESHFNPYAVSPEGAMGLMQIVSSSAGIDAMHAMGKYRAPTRDELYDPATNAQLGAKYVQLLRDRYLSGINNPEVREIAAIAAYNSGTNSTLKSFAKKQSQALEAINALTPQEVYDALKTKHRSKETRLYMQKVTSARGRYLNKEKDAAPS